MFFCTYCVDVHILFWFKYFPTLLFVLNLTHIVLQFSMALFLSHIVFTLRGASYPDSPLNKRIQICLCNLIIYKPEVLTFDRSQDNTRLPWSRKLIISYNRYSEENNFWVPQNLIMSLSSPLCVIYHRYYQNSCRCLW